MDSPFYVLRFDLVVCIEIVHILYILVLLRTVKLVFFDCSDIYHVAKSGSNKPDSRSGCFLSTFNFG